MPGRASLTPSGEFISPGWTSGPVAIAAGFGDRWRGLRPSPTGFGLLLKGRSVHSFGMEADLVVIGLAADGTVLATKVLKPHRIATMPAARFILELEAHRSPPAPGSVLTWDGAGSADPLRHSHRQPR